MAFASPSLFMEEGFRVGVSSAHAQQYVEGQLIQPLVGQVPRAQAGAIKCDRFQLVRPLPLL